MTIKEIYDEEGTYKEQFLDLTGYCFKMCAREDFEKDWDTAIQDKAIMGVLEDEELACSIILSKKAVYMNGQPVKMYGIGGVATSSTYRKGGVCTKLLKHCLEYMNEQEVVYSMLAPFSYEFYGKMGWKWCYTGNEYELDIDRLKGVRGDKKIVKYKDNDYDALNTYYHEQVRNINGCMLREKIDWDKRFAPKDDRYTVICKDDAGQIEGYMIYKIIHQTVTFEVVEINYSTVEALRTMINYIYNHSAQTYKVKIIEASKTYVRDIISSAAGSCGKKSSMMGRIINAERALKVYPFQKDGVFTIYIEDNVCDWNNGGYQVSIKEGKIQVEVLKEVDEVDMKIDIRELAQLLIGFRTINELEFLKEVEVKDDTIKAFFKPRRDTVALYDYF